MRSRLGFGDPESHGYNADTAPDEAVCEKSSAEQRSLKWGTTVPVLQQPLPQTITVPEVQERSTVKRIHQCRRLAVANAEGEESTNVLRSVPREVMANAPTDESTCRMPKSHSEYDSDSVLTIPRYTAATGNPV
jgi:hypothetical protein